MIIYKDGTVFNTDAKAIVNTVNCVGVMSAGIALEYSLRYPAMYENYVEKCKNKLIKVGVVDYFIDGDITIINFPTKWHFKYPSQLKWIEDGLKNFVETYKQNNITSVAFTKLGTLNGHLNWSDVKCLMEKYLSNLDIDVYICLDVKKEAEGVELKMLDILNNEDLNNLKNKIRITSTQIKTLEGNKPFTRFWKVRELDGIGTGLYSKLHNYCYEQVKNGVVAKQISMF